MSDLVKNVEEMLLIDCDKLTISDLRAQHTAVEDRSLDVRRTYSETVRRKYNRIDLEMYLSQMV